jgi:hypothetical protein
MSIYLLMRLYASSLFQLSPVGQVLAHFNDSEIASTRLKEISNGMV